MYKLKEVVVEITEQCNLNCMHCGSACGHQAAKDELSIEEWENVLSQFSEIGVEKIVFSGGEPTLKSGFEEILLFSSKLNIKTGFISNGLSLFNEALRKAIFRSKPFAVGLSIDGLKEVHNKVRRNERSWQGLIRNISILQELKVQICVVTTLHKLNYRELPKLARFLDFAGVDSWQLQLAMPLGRMREQANILVTEDDFGEICEQVAILRRQYPSLNIQSSDCFGVAPENSIRSSCWSGCTAGISSMGIDACGRAMPCLSLQDGQKHESLRDISVLEIWENSNIFDFNRKFLRSNVEDRSNCMGCKFLDECRGGCASQSFSYYGYFHSSPFCFFRNSNH